MVACIPASPFVPSSLRIPFNEPGGASPDGSVKLTGLLPTYRWKFVSPLETPRVYNYNGMFSPVDADAPDLARYPAFAQVKVLETTLEPGDTLFLPLGWWHQVAGLEVSVSLSFSNLGADNEFTYQDPSITDW